MRRSFLMSAALPAIAARTRRCASEADTTATDTTPSPTTSQDCSPESLQTLTPAR